MSAWLLLGALLLLASVIAVRLFLSADPKAMAQLVRYVIGTLLVLVSLPLIFRGNIALGLPVMALGLMVFGRRLPPGLNPFGSAGVFGPGGRSQGQTSSINTATLRMTLDHDTGQMDGEVLAGPFASQVLSAMSLEELIRLLDMCRRDDPDAAQLLEAYLQRHRADELGADWDAGSGDEPPPGAFAGGQMSRDEAYAVLGLEPGASEDEILKAHRQLMKRFHPDQGGSNYLASKINEAKDVLVGS